MKRPQIIFSTIFLTVMSLGIAFAGISGILLIGANYEKNLVEMTFQNKKPDLVAIFTGDTGRIQFGIDLALHYQAPKILISGVYNQVSLNKIIADAGGGNKQLTQFLKDNVMGDYYSRNTVENVLSTLFVMKQNPDFRDVIIVSHDYHIMRIKLILEQMEHPENFHFYYYSMESEFFTWRGFKILLKEVFKYIQSRFFFLIWETGPL